MGRKTTKPMGGGSKKAEVQPWQGHYGTTEAMVVEEINEKQVIAKDDGGHYVTDKKWVGKKMADPNRLGEKRYKFEEISEDIKRQKEEAEKRYKENKMAEHEFEMYILPHMRETFEGRKR